MYIKEIWRYPVKSMAGERLKQAEVTTNGIAGDRQILVVGANGRVVTSRTRSKLLGLKGTLGEDGIARVNGEPWNSPQVREWVQQAAGPGASLTHYTGPERFDILPLLVATDGAIDHMQIDGRRLRPNLVIGGVDGLTERQWPGRRMRIGNVQLYLAQLRGRCVMTTFDPDTLRQDLNVLKRIATELDGTMALNTDVEAAGEIREGDEVSLLP
jgi:uncharacterized protein YcbX